MNDQQKILLIEDNPDDEILTIKAFRKNHLLNEIMVIRDGAEALDYLNSTGVYENAGKTDYPSFILLDLKLPKVDGLEVLKSIKVNRYTKFIPVVILTTSKEESDLITSYKYGVNSFVRKPIDFNEFVQVVSQIGVYWMNTNEKPQINSELV